MDKAKIRLSAKEADLVTNADWILTKNHILQKVKYILEYLQSEQEQFLSNSAASLPAEVMAVPPKISKGENYKGLPYMVLDHPRYFGKEGYFAIRSMFWWGNFFSITLQLSGTYKRMYENKIESSFTWLKKEDFYISTGDDQWEHHFGKGNYLPLKEMNETNFKKNINNKEFIKLAKRFSLEQWEDTGDSLVASFREIMKWLTV